MAVVVPIKGERPSLHATVAYFKNGIPNDFDYNL